MEEREKSLGEILGAALDQSQDKAPYEKTYTEAEVWELLNRAPAPPMSLSKRVSLFFSRLGSVAMILIVATLAVMAWSSSTWFEYGQAIGIALVIGVVVQLFFNLIGWAVSALFPD